MAAQRQSGRAVSCLRIQRQGAKFNDIRCPHRVVLDVSTPALDMRGFHLSPRREAPPPTRAFVLAAAAIRMRERHPAGREETCPARSRCWRIQPFVGCSRGSCCRLGREQSAMRGEGVCVACPLFAHWNPLRPESHYNRLKGGELLTRWARVERKNVAVAKGQRSAALV